MRSTLGYRAANQDATQASEDDIKKAFKGGDDDGDDTLSVSEAVTAVEKLSGTQVWNAYSITTVFRVVWLTTHHC